MNTKAIAATLLFLTPTVGAQPDGRTLAGIIAAHEVRMAKATGDPEAYEKSFETFVGELEAHLKTAPAKERNDTRFTLAGTLLAMNRRDKAKAALGGFDPGSSTCVDCGNAALLADSLQMDKERAAWIDAALGKKSSFHDRMEFGVILMARLAEVKLAEELFEEALKAARDDEERAAVTWFLAIANREREDIPEGRYDELLRELADKLPKTRYGRIAGDRLRAMNFKVGHDAIPFAQATLDGKTFDLGKQKGSAVLLAFLAAEIEVSSQAARALQEVHQQFGGKGLRVLGVWLDRTKARAAAAVEKLGLTFPQTWCEGGWESDLALRYRVEDAPHCLLIGRDGKIAGLNFVLTDERGLRDVLAAVQQVLK